MNKQDEACRSFYLHPLRRDEGLDQQLQDELANKETSNRQYMHMMEFRKKLPSYKMRKVLQYSFEWELEIVKKKAKL